MGKLWTEHKLWQILNALAVQYAKCFGALGGEAFACKLCRSNGSVPGQMECLSVYGGCDEE